MMTSQNVCSPSAKKDENMSVQGETLPEPWQARWSVHSRLELGVVTPSCCDLVCHPVIPTMYSALSPASFPPEKALESVLVTKPKHAFCMFLTSSTLLVLMLFGIGH